MMVLLVAPEPASTPAIWQMSTNAFECDGEEAASMIRFAADRLQHIFDDDTGCPIALRVLADRVELGGLG